jgi:hypothetical protein
MMIVEMMMMMIIIIVNSLLSKPTSTTTTTTTSLLRSTEVLAAAAELKVEAEQRSRALDTIVPLRAGKKGPSGRMDYRASEHPVMCIGE